MGRWLTENDRMQIINLWMNHGYTQLQIKDIMECSVGVVNNTIKEYTSTGAHEPPAGLKKPERCKLINQQGRKKGIQYER